MKKPKNSSILKIISLSLIIVGFSSCSDDDEGANAGTTSSQITTVPFFVETDNKEMPSSGDQLLYETRKHEPIIAPDGKHLTWADFSKVNGSVVVDCVPEGARISLNLKGLIPDGVYTIWNVTFEEPGMDPSEEMLSIDGLGAGGKGDGSDNYFTASATGTASISMVTPGGPLSMLGTIGACPLTDNFEWHIIGTYHLDGKTYGPDLGPDGTVAEQFAFIFKQESSQ